MPPQLSPIQMEPSNGSRWMELAWDANRTEEPKYPSTEPPELRCATPLENELTHKLPSVSRAIPETSSSTLSLGLGMFGSSTLSGQMSIRLLAALVPAVSR